MTVNLLSFASVMATVGGVLGAAVATLGVVLPSFIIILLLCRCFDRFQKSRAVKGCMSGIKPSVIGLIAAALLSVGRAAFDFSDFWV